MISTSALLRKTLIISPHADDEVLGCGGLMHTLRETGDEVHVLIAVTADSFLWHHGGVVTGETRRQETRHACASLGVCGENVHFLYEQGDGRLDTVPQQELVMALDLLLRRLRPTAVLIPYPSFHQDHRALFQACFAALRPRAEDTVALVAMYEYPNIVWQYDQLPGGDWYLRLDEAAVEAKVEAMLCHTSQIREGPHPISPDSIRTWARYRGMEIGAPAAERFRVLRAIS
ncbi:PIG-L deacetylase family protein [Deinococcus planocerae]|uniref:PIG-L deacetylase family protein n=1 Tax=Deinococcus planocerae TaxID=1737569 RepID=UPI000C7F50EF|nr:PIG-L deacetylase family protein [Deinococcus planocerae]